MNRISRIFGFIVLFAIILGGTIFSFPSILELKIHYEQKRAISAMYEQFPITVDPKNKAIAENAQVNAFLENPDSPFQAAAGNAGNIFGTIFEWIAIAVSDSPWYQNIAAVAALHNRLVAITPGMRKEQVATAFASALAWNTKQKKEFLIASSLDAYLPLPEGSFSPGIYLLAENTTPREVQTLVNERFTEDILSHYGSEIAKVVPLEQALTIASLIEREAGGADDMRLISGIIWNRLFINMRLQIDATLQYAKANSVAGVGWWPKPVPADRFRTSPYNTYLHSGLPPTPIANPSVASVLAALNPRDTSCLFYFHDAAKQFHCTDTYAEHVALLKKYFGRGK